MGHLTFVSNRLSAVGNKIFDLYSFISRVHGVTECCMPRIISQINIHIFKTSLPFGDRPCLHYYSFDDFIRKCMP